MGETIYALATPPGVSGVAIIRVSGPLALESLEGLLKDARRPKDRVVALRTLYDPQTGEAIDQGLVVCFPAPKSFTGETCVEYHLHGSRAVLSHMLDVLSHFPGHRLANPGEFTERAFWNGRLDLVEVEALSDVLKAQTRTQHRQALWHLTGEASAVFQRWRGTLLRALALTEATIDFSDEGDVVADTDAEVRALVFPLFEEIMAHFDDHGRGEKIREGLSIVIAGPPNAGKSSLLNALAKRDVAMVSEIAGTTRDGIEIAYDLEGLSCRIVDTAGLRAQTQDPLEREGMVRTVGHIQSADVLLWVEAEDARAEDGPEQAYSCDVILKIWNKTDLCPPPSGLYFPLSTRDSGSLDRLLAHIKTQIIALFQGGEPALITRARHRQALKDALAHLAPILEMEGGKALSAELRAEHLRLGAEALGSLIGVWGVEDVLGVIFQEFCVGK